ncbi:MAG: hypothetical protein LUD51_04980 [Clostridia bacterium]|nr:hypothetical protein [Clostridia bacterium]
MTFVKISIMDLLRHMEGSALKKLLKNFSCPKNPDVEAFIRYKAIGFAKKKTAVTYLVLGTDGSSSDEPSSKAASPLILGYFTLANKSLAKPETAPDAETEEILSRFARTPVEGGSTKVMASLLIAQFAKNDALSDDVKAEFKGSELMNFALGQVRHLHNEMGGSTVFLECEDIEALKKFYGEQGFFLIGKRKTKDVTSLLQYMKVLQ